LQLCYNYFTNEDDIIGLNQLNHPIYFLFDPQKNNTSILSSNRTTPINHYPFTEATIVSPFNNTSTLITVGPNPVSVRSSAMIFYWNGDTDITYGTLFVYDVSGHLVKKIILSPLSNANGRIVGEWNMKDERGHTVSVGSYAVKGTVTSRNGKNVKISLVVGVGR